MDIDEMIKKEWRELGFYYEIDEIANTKEWKFYGDKEGLFKFVKLLNDYTTNNGNNYISEHQHYGPYGYLKIMTWDKPTITENYIAGTIKDLINLKNIIADKIDTTQPGKMFILSSDYGIQNTASVKFFVMPDNFDPVSMDGNYN